jgi:23S rRNA G2069 N7-methylase RlmK/C1962 C5-methylase RlmI
METNQETIESLVRRLRANAEHREDWDAYTARSRALWAEAEEEGVAVDVVRIIMGVAS